MYEKFCFLNNFTERTISDQEGQDMLGNYCFALQNDKQTSQVFTKLVTKSKSLTPTIEQLDQKGSIELFINCQYDITNLETDVEWYEDFEENYKEFCLKYRINEEPHTIDQLMNKYGFEKSMQYRKVLARTRANGEGDSQSGASATAN